jgi:phage-related protein
MSDFPSLKTGAVIQYPAEKETRFSSQVIRFVDGSEQRFRDFGASLRRWVIRLDSLDETELGAMRTFFRTQRGAAGTFSFTDPWDGTAYDKCTLETDEMVEELFDEGRSRTTLVVRESRS